MKGLLWANIKKRPTRTIVSIFAVSLSVIMVLLFEGLTNGLIKDYAQRTKNTRADLFFQPPGSSLLFALNNATMPYKIKDKLMEVPGIKYVAPMIHQFNKKNFSLIFGIEPDSFNKVSGNGLIVVEGRIFKGGYECVVDDIYKKSHHTKLGDKIKILNHYFTVVGIFKSGVGARILVPLKTLQDLNDAHNKVSIFYIKCDTKKDIDRVYKYLKNTPPFKGYTVNKASNIYKLMTSSLPGLKEFTFVLIAVSVIISFFVILLTMYTTISERTREIGILKSLGASKRYIIFMILKEAITLTSVGLGLGIGLTYSVVRFLHKIKPSLPIEIQLKWIFIIIGLALFSGVFGSFYPAFKAARQDPVDALTFE